MQTVLSATQATELGRRIQESRQARGWSLAEVSRRTGLSRAYISALERGGAKRPGADALRRLEDVLGQLLPVLDGATLPEVPVGLRQLAQERRLAESEVQMLAGLHVRGKQPSSADRWRFIYDALVTSETIDVEEPNAAT